MQTRAFTASAVKLHFYGNTMIGILSLGGAKVLFRKMWWEWRTLVHTHLAVFLRAYRSAFQRPTFLFCERFPYARSLNASAHGRFPFNPEFRKFWLVHLMERTISVWSDRNIRDQLWRSDRLSQSVGPKYRRFSPSGMYRSIRHVEFPKLCWIESAPCLWKWNSRGSFFFRRFTTKCFSATQLCTRDPL